MSKFGQYVHNDACVCPFCGSDDIEAGPMEEAACQPVRCNACGEEWEDIYQLVGVRYNGKEYFVAAEDSNA